MKIDNFFNYLNKLFPNAKCSLNYSKDYELVIAVMLSAQTTDKAVNKVTSILFKKYKTLSSLKKARLSDIENILHPLGMYKVKAKNVLGIANALNKIVPNTREELMKLPGVGQKVANVVLAELYNLPYFAVDTHVSRIAKRIGVANDSDNPKEIEKKMLKVLPKDKMILINHQMIEFGRAICHAKNPDCVHCLVKCKSSKTFK